MNLTIRGHHTSVNDDLRGHAEKKLARLERYLPRVDSAVIEVEHEETRSAKHRYAVHITVHSGHTVLRAEERGADPRAALEVAADALARQAQRHKQRLHDRSRGPGGKAYTEAIVNAPVETPQGETDENSQMTQMDAEEGRQD